MQSQPIESKGTITGTVADFKASKGKVKKNVENRSKFFITFNTQQHYKPDDPNIENDVDFLRFQCLEPLLNERLHEFIIYKEEGKNWNDDILDVGGSEYTVELGQKQHKLHAHILLDIKHKTKIHLNIPAMREYLENVCGLKGIHLNVRSVYGANSTINLENYLNKWVYKQEPLHTEPALMTEENTEPVAEPASVVPVEKKPRGRPRTKPLPNPDAPKPRRGRPPKQPIAPISVEDFTADDANDANE